MDAGEDFFDVDGVLLFAVCCFPGGVCLLVCC